MFNIGIYVYMPYVHLGIILTCFWLWLYHWFVFIHQRSNKAIEIRVSFSAVLYNISERSLLLSCSKLNKQSYINECIV